MWHQLHPCDPLERLSQFSAVVEVSDKRGKVVEALECVLASPGCFRANGFVLVPLDDLVEDFDSLVTQNLT